MSSYAPLQCVLFDLDGTLLDTSQDMAKALNQLLIERGRKSLPYEQIRPQVSHGARGLLKLGFDMEPTDPAFTPFRDRYLALYEQCMLEQTQLFEGLNEVLAYCEQHELRWGVVTNKPGYLTRAVMEHLHLWQRAACVVAGDCLPQRKPDPAPMHHASQMAGVDSQACCYVGDAERDIEAGRRAGMRTICALWGFIDADEQPQNWQADHYLQRGDELIALIDLWRHQTA
jgi:N-acetyl-D-muramate 6-phosphate phosphatase